MGSPDSEEGRSVGEGPQHFVTLASFFISESEVTQKQWMEVMDSNPSIHTNCEECPVENVSWNEVQDFISKLNNRRFGLFDIPARNKLRLPTEAEWEYACRAGSTGPYPNELDAVAWYKLNAGDETHPVKQKVANAWALFDMHGNVYEWVQDWYSGLYPAGPVTNPSGPSSGSKRLVRGGGASSAVAEMRSAGRWTFSPDDRGNRLGFRLVYSPA